MGGAGSNFLIVSNLKLRGGELLTTHMSMWFGKMVRVGG